MPKWQALREDRVMVQVRLPRELVRRLDHLGVDLGQYRQAVVETLLTEALAARERAGGAGGAGAAEKCR